MKLNSIGITLCLAAATASFSSYAGDHRKASRDHRHAESAMQLVAVDARAGEPGHGWQYFSDVPRHRAVVISPDGDYYYSRGKGLELVYKGAGAA